MTTAQDYLTASASARIAALDGAITFEDGVLTLRKNRCRIQVHSVFSSRDFWMSGYVTLYSLAEYGRHGKDGFESDIQMNLNDPVDQFYVDKVREVTYTDDTIVLRCETFMCRQPDFVKF